MNYTIRDTVLTQQEFDELWAILGEHRRICRDQVTRWVKEKYEDSDNIVSKERLEISENLISKLIEEVKNKNIYTK